MKAQLEALITNMYRDGIRYSEAVREFRRTFIATVIRENKGNQLRSARELGMHRNTLRRILSDLELDINSLRPTARRYPPQSVRPIWAIKKQQPR
jgi:Fis family transcriptional regulator